MQKFTENSIVFKKPNILPEKLETLAIFNYHRVKYFLLKFCIRFPLTNVYKSVFGNFFILFRSWVIYKNLKRTYFYTLTETTSIKNSRFKQN